MRAFALPLAAFVFALLAATLCRAAAGVSLGLFFGGALFATLIVSPLTAGETTPANRLSVPCCVTLGVAAVWLSALGDLLTLPQWLACSAALLAYALALAGTCSALIAIRVNAVASAALVTVLGLLWLTWPVWLSHALLRPGGDEIAGWLVPAHPLFAINGVLSHFDTWDRYRLAYSRLTVLNQDVFYALPTGVLWTTLAHGLWAAVTFALAWFIRSKRRDPAAPPRLSAAEPRDTRPAPARAP